MSTLNHECSCSFVITYAYFQLKSIKWKRKVIQDNCLTVIGFFTL